MRSYGMCNMVGLWRRSCPPGVPGALIEPTLRHGPGAVEGGIFICGGGLTIQGGPGALEPVRSRIL